MFPTASGIVKPCEHKMTFDQTVNKMELDSQNSK